MRREDDLDVTYKNTKMKRVCTEADYATKNYGELMAEKIHMRIDQIIAAETVEEMVQYRIGRCHALHNNRKGQYAVDLVHPYRLIFEVNGNEIQIAKIMEVVDYH